MHEGTSEKTHHVDTAMEWYFQYITVRLYAVGNLDTEYLLYTYLLSCTHPHPQQTPPTPNTPPPNPLQPPKHPPLC